MIHGKYYVLFYLGSHDVIHTKLLIAYFCIYFEWYEILVIFDIMPHLIYDIKINRDAWKLKSKKCNGKIFCFYSVIIFDYPTNLLHPLYSLKSKTQNNLN